MVHRRKTKDELLEGCAVVLEDPALCRIIVDTFIARPVGVPSRVKKVADSRGFKHHIRSALHRAAVLVRENPETIVLFAAKANENRAERDRSEQAMSDTNIAEKKVLTAEYLYSGKRFQFTWGDLPCELTVPQDQTEFFLNFIREKYFPIEGKLSLITDSSGFIVRVAFPPRQIFELADHFRFLAEKQVSFKIFGINVSPKIIPYHQTPDAFEYEDGLYLQEWLEKFRVGRSKNPTNPFSDLEIGCIIFKFLCGPDGFDPNQFSAFHSRDFRNAYMLACLNHYFGIETEEIEYKPVVEEEKTKPLTARVTDGQMSTLLDFISEDSVMDLHIEIAALIMKMLKCTDNLSRPVILDVKISESELSGAVVCEQINGRGGKRLNRLLRLAGSEFSASARVTPTGRLKFTISRPEDEDESKFVVYKLDELV